MQEIKPGCSPCAQQELLLMAPHAYGRLHAITQEQREMPIRGSKKGEEGGTYDQSLEEMMRR